LSDRRLWVKSTVLASAEHLPVYPDKQTFSESFGMSQKCQKQTHALQQAGLFDHLVGLQQ
jgi:hypothetical protein